VEAEAVLGLIAAPNRGHVDFGVPDWGAQRYPLFAGGDAEALVTRSLDAANPLVMSASARHREERVQVMLGRLSALAEGAERLDAGSALKFCDVASGAADVYPRTSPCYEWDVAAGDALVWAAGGFVVDLWGNPIQYNSRESLLVRRFIATSHGGEKYLPLLLAMEHDL